jgi:anti-anti-sigma factor
MYSERSFDLPTEDQPWLLVELQGSGSVPPRMVVSGEIDALTAAQLQKAVVDVLRHQRPAGIEMDLSGVTFLDSAGIRALVLCQADARQVECQITLTNPQPIVYRTLQITGLLEHFGLAKSQPSDRPLSAMAGASSGLRKRDSSTDGTERRDG